MLYHFLTIVVVFIFKLLKKKKFKLCMDYFHNRNRVGGSGSGQSNLIDINCMSFENPSFNNQAPNQDSIVSFHNQAPNQDANVSFHNQAPNQHSNMYQFDVNHPNHPSRILEAANLAANVTNGSNNNMDLEAANLENGSNNNMDLAASSSSKGQNHKFSSIVIDSDLTVPMVHMGIKNPRRSPRFQNNDTSSL